LQFGRSFSICYDGTGWHTVAWALQFVLLLVPAVASWQRWMESGNDRDTLAIRFVLLACLPVTLALRLVEWCSLR
jgi:hypothetical protein